MSGQKVEKLKVGGACNSGFLYETNLTDGRSFHSLPSPRHRVIFMWLFMVFIQGSVEFDFLNCLSIIKVNSKDSSLNSYNIHPPSGVVVSTHCSHQEVSGLNPGPVKTV